MCSNFGYGSSREHAPWVFEVNGINTVIAESFARIFRHAGDSAAAISIDMEAQTLNVSGGGKQKSLNFEISPFDKALVSAGGWVDYADQKY